MHTKRHIGTVTYVSKLQMKSNEQKERRKLPRSAHPVNGQTPRECRWMPEIPNNGVFEENGENMACEKRNGWNMLVGGFSPPIWKILISQNGFIFPNFRGEKKKYLKPPPSMSISMYTTCIHEAQKKTSNKDISNLYMCPVWNRWVVFFFVGEPVVFFLDCLAHFHTSKPSTCSILWYTTFEIPIRQCRLYLQCDVIYVK